MMIYYKNSLLASVVSILGCMVIMLVILEFGFDEDGIKFLLLGLALLAAGKLISNRKVFKTWWKQVEDLDLVDKIRQDGAVAKMVYDKNPKRATLKKIEKLNPTAAEAIRASKKK